MSALLPLLFAVPLIAAGVLMIARPPQWWKNTVLYTVIGGQLIMSALLLAATAHGDVVAMRVADLPGPVAIPLVADTFSAIMLVLICTVSLAVIPFAIRSGAAAEPFFTPLVMLLMAGVPLALVTADLFNLFVGIEVMLLPSYGLLMLAHRGQGLRMQVAATRIYIAVNLLTSSMLLIGIAVLYSHVGSVGYAALIGGGLTSISGKAGAAIVLLALSIKAAVVPAHGWIGRVYPHMSPTMSALFSGIHTKVAVYAVFRMHSILFDGQDTWMTLGMIVFAVSMVLGAFAAHGERTARGVLTLSMVSQMGYILLGLAVHTPLAISAAIFYLVHNVITKTSLFLSTGAIEIAYGRHVLGSRAGLWPREKLLSLAYFLGLMSLAGLPPMSGFIAKAALVFATFRSGYWLAGAIALAVSLITLMYLLRIWATTFLGKTKLREKEGDAEPGGPRIGYRLAAPSMVLALLALALGLGAEGLFHLTGIAAGQLLDPSFYGEAIR